MWETYDGHIEVNLPRTLTAGDDRCVFRVYHRELAQKKDGERPGEWMPPGC